MSNRSFLNELRRFVSGPVLLPGSSEYDSARKLFNGFIDKYPQCIVRCADFEDISHCVKIARAHEVLTAIRAGGHNVAGRCLCDGGLVIDLSRLRSVVINPTTRTAVVAPGATWFDFDQQAQKFGLATTGGVISSTGVGGLTLGGGVGWLMGSFGLSCDNLISSNLTTADGSRVCASDEETPDLMWALRGGGGNFGVVTSFKFRLHEVSRVMAGSFRFGSDSLLDCLHSFREASMMAPDELTLDCVLSQGDEGEFFGTIDACQSHQTSLGRNALDILERRCTSTDLALRTYGDWQQYLDDPRRNGRRSYWKCLSLKSLPDSFLELLPDVLRSSPSRHTMLTFDHLHGEASRIGMNSSYGHRDKKYLFLINANWEDPADDDINLAWSKRAFSEILNACPDAESASYVNYLSEEGDSRIRSSYSQAIWDKLRLVKGRYDPTNFFRCNQNIAPI